MNNTQIKPLNHLELLRKYKYINAIPSEELREAQTTIPKGKNGLQCLFEAAREYQKELAEEAERTGTHPNVCFGTDCDDDHCRCWDK